ncbi:chorismate synthase [bacterium]|nr:chorismate synthase [bacterium]
MRFLTAGESHGECLSAIIEGVPFGYELDFDFINSELSARQQGYGRGGRMAIEKDCAKITSGVRHGITTASPIALTINNKDWQNWMYPMSVQKLDFETLDDETKAQIEAKKITNFRPAHSDLAACEKYNFDDIRYSLERSSARETATRVGVGAICQNILINYDIEFFSEILSIGQCRNSEEFESYIKSYQEKGDSLGGIAKVTVKNVPPGLGSFVHYDKRLDSRLAGAIMSIPAVKSVEIGLGKEYAMLSGSITHDEIYYNNNKYYHKTNNSGGIEGGMSNGEDIVITLAMKPIPTMKHPLNSVELKTHNKVSAHFERADNCAVEACSVVARNMTAIVILDAFLDKFTGDTKLDIDNAYNSYIKRLNEI